MLALVREQRQKEKHKANIYGLYVAPRERRSGVARRLRGLALAQARKMKIRQIRLRVEASNAAAVRL